MVRVVVASDKFKGSLTAAQVAQSVTRGIRQILPAAEVAAVPVADGGDGTLAAALAAGFTQVRVKASGPTGELLDACYARRGDLAVVELADVSGLARLPASHLAPLTATSRGTGEVVAAAVAAGCRRVVLGVGGSASTDGGAGLLVGLGARLLGRTGHEVGDGGMALREVARVDLGALRDRLAGVEVTVACDVDNPLLGPRGAAAVYGPQKGANAEQVVALDVALGHWADIVAAACGSDRRDTPGAGAAGGVGFAALAVLGGALHPGIELMLDLVDFGDRLRGADLVVTGEGSLDEQTLHGKAPAGVARAARDVGVDVVAVCGRTTLTPDQLRAAGIGAAYPLLDLQPDPQRCMREAAGLLERIGARIAEQHLCHDERTPTSP